ncbi:MAG: hypothetical protein EHM45_05125 [Desulfobacteraceae bacterium]|nr:MAG: hypothetical protein EHM45_05125 [Desulfobacteraceae bacterium]
MKLRLLLILPLAGGSLVVGRHFADAVRDRPGLELDVLEMQPLCEQYEHDTRAINAKKERLAKISEQLNLAALRRVAAFKPDLVLVMALAPLGPWFIEQVKHLNARTAHWYIENFRYYPANPLIPPWQVLAPVYDYFFSIQCGEFFEKLKTLGQTHYHYLPTAHNPAVHYPHRHPLPTATDRADVVFIGSPYPNRVAVFQDLSDFDLALWGPGWSAVAALQSRARGNNQWIESRDECRILNGAKIALNIHSSLVPGRLIEKSDFLNPRVFTVAACGAFQMVDDSEPLAEAFEPGAEVAVYSDLPSLKEQLAHYLTNPAARNRMAQKAYQRVLAEHTYSKRMDTMLRFMNFI